MCTTRALRAREELRGARVEHMTDDQGERSGKKVVSPHQPKRSRISSARPFDSGMEVREASESTRSKVLRV